MPDQNYRSWLKEDLTEVIEVLPLPDLQKRFLRSRWLEQLLWLEAKAEREQHRYYALRIVAIIGGVFIPALVSLDLAGSPADWARWAAFVLGLIVSGSVSLEGFFRFGERWRHYRRTAELLKIEGWQYFELGGAYEGKDHATAFSSFAARTEAIMLQDVEGFVSVIAAEARDQRAPTSAPVTRPPTPPQGAPAPAPNPVVGGR